MTITILTNHDIIWPVNYNIIVAQIIRISSRKHTSDYKYYNTLNYIVLHIFSEFR